MPWMVLGGTLIVKQTHPRIMMQTLIHCKALHFATIRYCLVPMGLDRLYHYCVNERQYSIVCGTNNHVKSEMLSNRHTYTHTTREQGPMTKDQGSRTNDQGLKDQ